MTTKPGTLGRTTCVFTELGTGDLADPGVVTCTITKPDGTQTTYTVPADITHPSVGVYQLLVMFDQAGLWEAEWVGTGSGPNVVECRTFTVDEAC